METVYDTLRQMAISLMLAFTLIITAAVLTACQSTNYQVGDLSRTYCSTDNEQIRILTKAALIKLGATVSVDYCLIHGFMSEVVHGNGN